MLVWCPFMMFSFRESLSALLLARVLCVSVFAAAVSRLLNVANVLCSLEQLFAVKHEIKDCLRVKAEQERLAVIQVELLSNKLWCWSGPLIPVESCQFITSKCSKSICVTLQALLCLGGVTVLVIYAGNFFTASGFLILCLTVILALKT